MGLDGSYFFFGFWFYIALGCFWWFLAVLRSFGGNFRFLVNIDGSLLFRMVLMCFL